MKRLKSFEEALDVFGKSCEDEYCRNLWGDGFYKHTMESEEENIIFFICSRGCKSEYEIGFKLTPDIKERLEQEVKGLLSNAPSKNASSFHFNDFFAESDRLLRKIGLYANIHPRGTEEEMRGYCQYCFNPVPMRIDENGKLWTGCETCASIIADSRD